MENQTSLDDDYHSLTFGVRRSIRYHAHRRGFYDRFNLFVNAFALIMGSATVLGTLKEHLVTVAIISAMLVTILSAVNLVVGSSRQARLHHDLCKQFIELEKKITSCKEKNEENYALFVSERLDIEAEEPPVLHVLNCICHNELSRAMGYGEEHFAKITLIQRMFAPILDIRSHALKVG